MDYIEPIPFLVIMALIVAAWLIIGVRDRRKWQAEADAWHRAIGRIRYVERARGCATVWWSPDAHDYGVCNRPDEHTGPHFDTVSRTFNRQ